MCSPSTRGIWMDFICAMHELGRIGQVTGTPDQLCRICRCTAAEMNIAIAELKATKTAEIHERNGSVTVICRRLQREFRERLTGRERVWKHRRNEIDAPVEIPDVTEMKRGSNAPSSVFNLPEEELSTNVLNGTSPAKTRRPRRKVLDDNRSKHIAIQTLRGIVKLYPPKEIWDKLITILGDEPDHIKLLECRAEWMERGFKPTNWKWVTDWYVNGIPSREVYGQKRIINGHAPITLANSTPDEMFTEVERFVRARSQPVSTEFVEGEIL